MRSVTVQVDNREKAEILFPSQIIWCPRPYVRQMVGIKVERCKLQFGDYRLKAYPKMAGVETKRSLDELAGNLLTADRVRFGKAFGGFLDAYAYPILMVEQAFGTTNLKGRYEKITPPDVMAAFWKLVPACRKLIVVWSGETRSPATRRLLGAQVVRMMLSLAYHHVEEAGGTEEAERTEEAGEAAPVEVAESLVGVGEAGVRDVG